MLLMKRNVAIETEELKRQSRVFHQRLLAAVEGQLSLASAPEWVNCCNQQLFIFKTQMLPLKKLLKSFGRTCPRFK